MTDLQRFISMYRTFGIVLIPNTLPNGEIEIQLGVDDDSRTVEKDGVKYEYFTSHSPKFTGYSGFHSSVTFTSEGKFISQGFWE